MGLDSMSFLNGVNDLADIPAESAGIHQPNRLLRHNS
jgi:hypothetical protein